MVATVGALGDGEGTLEQRPSARHIIQIFQDGRQIAEAHRHPWMLRTEGPLIDRQRPFRQGSCRRGVAQRREDRRQIAQTAGHPLIVRTIGRLIAGQRLLQQRSHLGQASVDPQVSRGPAQDQACRFRTQMKGGRQDVGQQLRPAWPTSELILAILRSSLGQQPQRSVRDIRPVSSGAYRCLQQSMEGHRLGRSVEQQRVVAQGTDRLMKGQRIGGRTGQRLGQYVGVLGEEIERNGFGSEVGTDLDHLNGSRVLLGQPVQTQLPERGDRLFPSIRVSATLQDVAQSSLQELGVGPRVDPGPLQVGGGLLQGKREVPE